MRVAALLLMFGMGGAGAFWMKAAAPGASPTGGTTQSTPAGAPIQTSLKIELKGPNGLQLQPDQTTTADVMVTYPKAVATGAPADCGEKQKKPPKKPPAQRPKTTVKKTAKKKVELSKQGQSQPPGQVTTSEPAVAVKFYLNMDKTEEYPACVASVTPLIGEPSLKPGDPPVTVPISISSCNPKGGNGTLFLSSTKAQGVAVTLKPRRSPWLSAIVIGSLVVALLICVFAGKAVSAEGHKLCDMMNQIAWDFSSSWASNITAFGAAFVFLLNLSASLDKPHLGSKGEYQFIAAFALALAMLAPAIHRLTSTTEVINPKTDEAQGDQNTQSDPTAGAEQGGQNAQSDPTAVTVGFVGGFLAASAFTIWGTLLQSAGELLIVYELKRAGTVYVPIIVAVGICVAVTAMLLMIYCWKGILSTVAANAMRTGQTAPIPGAMFASAAPNGKTIFRRTMSGRKAAVL
jgi:hypothetical protein